MTIRVKHSGLVKLTARRDARRGNLFVAEARKEVPFPIRRVYIICDIKNRKAIRGNHAHKKLTQAIFCVNGSFVLGLDDGKRKQKLVLKNPARGVILGPGLWHTMTTFSKDCVILVFADNYHRESDYIRSYDDFVKIARRL